MEEKLWVAACIYAFLVPEKYYLNNVYC